MIRLYSIRAPGDPVMGRDLERKDCRFPLWGDHEAPTHLYCGKPCLEGQSWCEEHAAIVWRKTDAESS